LSDSSSSAFSAFCPKETTVSLYGNYLWPSIKAEESTYLDCAYGGFSDHECILIDTLASRRCDEYGVWEESNESLCISQVTQQLCMIRNVRQLAYVENTTCFKMLHQHLGGDISE